MNKSGENMDRIWLTVVCVAIFGIGQCSAQVMQFGSCAYVEPMKLFNIDKFLGKWYEIERFPMWYEDYGVCAYKHFERCGKRLEIQHAFTKNGVQYILHVDSSYTSGQEAVFQVNQSNIDPIGIPLSVVSTDYKHYAVVYGCRANAQFKYMAAWILSRDTSMEPESLLAARNILNEVPFGNIAYLEPVKQTLDQCTSYWTAHINAEEHIEDKVLRLTDRY